MVFYYFFMRIGIDARMLGGGYGIGRYLEQMILHLAKLDSKNEYVVFLKKENFDLLVLPANFKKVLMDIAWYSFAEQLKLSSAIQKENVDLMHFPHFNVPLFYRDPYLVTIHDLIMFHYPRQEASTHGPLVYWIKDLVHRFVVKNSVQRARHIFVTSEYTKRDVHETLGTPLEKMTVTYQAPFEVKHLNNKGTEYILGKYGIKKPYIMYVGAAYPHKNLEGLVQAWKVFQKKYGSEYELVLVGKENFFYTKLKNTFLKESSGVIYTGFVPDDELSNLYKNATLYVFPSLYEGFGLPPLEAMTYGTPVVSSNKSCLPEVLQDAALYFDPENPVGMADTIYKGIHDETLRLTLQQNAQKLLPNYSWDTLAKQTVCCYTRGY